MQTWLQRAYDITCDQLMWFALCMVLFSVLARITPAVPSQKLLRREWQTDLWYWFLLPIFYAPISLLFITLLLLASGEVDIGALLNHGRAPFNQWPLWAQCVVIVLFSDIIQYLLHRGFHTSRFWRWHAIHHMPTQLDWLSSARFHPVNAIISSGFVGAIIVVAGFSPQALLYIIPFNVLYSAMVHANLNWHFGPLRYIFASPVFHRWHHTGPQHGGNKNFAPTFAFLDLLGGTFYMPANQSPQQHGFGVTEPIPTHHFARQLLWPFTHK